MKIRVKLPISFTALLLMVVAAALIGIFKLRSVVSLYEHEVMGAHAHEREVAALGLSFKTQVQEWKDTLLRGKDPKKLEQHWKAFTDQEAAVDRMAMSLMGSLPEGDSKRLIRDFEAAHRKLGLAYRNGFDAFKAAGFEAAAGDAAVAGMDREPTRLLLESGKKIAEDSARTSSDASAEASRASAVCLMLMAAAGLAGAFASYILSGRIARPMGLALHTANAIATGDLTTSVSWRGDDEIAMLMRALSEMQSSLAKLVSDARHSAESVSIAASEISQGASDLSMRTEEQAAALEETAASMDQLAATVKQNAENAQSANQLAGGANAVATRGGDAVNQVIETMRGIHDGSKRVADIIGVIDSIAFQTNILALNAAVEAARAGEQGRGFAVVAGEVRTLASRSSEAAKEIKKLISDSVERVEAGLQLVDRAGSTMADVVAAVTRVTDIMAEISAASIEQSAGVQQIGTAVSQMDQTTQQNAALVEQSAAAAESLRDQAKHLVAVVSGFKLP